MKRKSLLVLFLSILFLASCANDTPEEDNSLKCPAGKKSDYQTISQSSTTYNDMVSGKAYYGRGIWSSQPHIATKGTWLFETGDTPVTVKFSSKCEDRVSSSVEIRPKNLKGTSGGWQTISKPSDGFIVPADYNCSVDFTSNYWSTKNDICFEFYLHCSN